MFKPQIHIKTCHCKRRQKHPQPCRVSLQLMCSHRVKIHLRTKKNAKNGLICEDLSIQELKFKKKIKKAIAQVSSFPKDTKSQKEVCYRSCCSSFLAFRLLFRIFQICTPFLLNHDMNNHQLRNLICR